MSPPTRIVSKEAVNMDTILYTIAMWVLVQLLVVWFCARVAAVRRLDMQAYLELRAYAGRVERDSPTGDRLALASTALPAPKPVPPAGVARA